MILPKLDEVSHCIKMGLVNDRDLLVYKMLLDFWLEFYKNQKDDDISKMEQVIQTCIRFYDVLS